MSCPLIGTICTACCCPKAKIQVGACSLWGHWNAISRCSSFAANSRSGRCGKTAWRGNISFKELYWGTQFISRGSCGRIAPAGAWEGPRRWWGSTRQLPLIHYLRASCCGCQPWREAAAACVSESKWPDACFVCQRFYSLVPTTAHSGWLNLVCYTVVP